MGTKKLEDHVVAITGTPKIFEKQANLGDWIKAHGGKVEATVSARTTHLVKGDIDKANKMVGAAKRWSNKSHEIAILTEREYLEARADRKCRLRPWQSSLFGAKDAVCSLSYCFFAT